MIHIDERRPGRDGYRFGLYVTDDVQDDHNEPGKPYVCR